MKKSRFIGVLGERAYGRPVSSLPPQTFLAFASEKACKAPDIQILGPPRRKQKWRSAAVFFEISRADAPEPVLTMLQSGASILLTATRPESLSPLLCLSPLQVGLVPVSGPGSFAVSRPFCWLFGTMTVSTPCSKRACTWSISTGPGSRKARWKVP